MNKHLKYTYAVCYNHLSVYKTKIDAIRDFNMGCQCCDPMSNEYRRYASIIMDLQYNDIGFDGVSNKINEICFEENKKVIKVDWEDSEEIIEKIEKGEILYVE